MGMPTGGPGAPGSPYGPAVMHSGYGPPGPPPRPVAAKSFWITIAKIFGVTIFVLCIGAMFYVVIAHVIGDPVDYQLRIYEKPRERVVSGEGSDKVAILPIQGMINDWMLNGFRKRAKAVLEDDKVKAVVLEVDSGGGTVSASEEIYQIVEKLKAEGKKIVAHYGGLAASGALYCTAGADKIYAQENTLTGSIGVLTAVVVATDLMENKLGVKVETITSEDAKKKTLGTPIKLGGSFSEADRKELLRLLNHYHDLFVGRVFDGRKAANPNVTGGKTWSRKYVAAELADGSTFTFDEANANGLVDNKGDLEAAVKAAAGLAGLPGKYRVVRYVDLVELELGRALIQKDISINVNFGPLRSDELNPARGRFMFLSPYRR
jgi:protease-4